MPETKAEPGVEIFVPAGRAKAEEAKKEEKKVEPELELQPKPEQKPEEKPKEAEAKAEEKGRETAKFAEAKEEKKFVAMSDDKVSPKSIRMQVEVLTKSIMNRKRSRLKEEERLEQDMLKLADEYKEVLTIPPQ